MVPFPEFVCKITIAIPQVSEDPITIEFYANTAAILASADQNPKGYEIVNNQNNCQTILGIYTILDASQELMSSLNYKLPGYEVGISNIDSPKNRFVVLKYLQIYFPTGKKLKIEPRKHVTSSSLSNLRIDEDEEFDLAASPVGRPARKRNTKETNLQLNNFEDHLSNEAGEKGRTFTSLESPITNKSKNAQSLSSFSPTSLMESQFPVSTNQQPGSIVLNKANDGSRGTSLVLSDVPIGNKVGTTPNSLSNIDDSNRGSPPNHSRAIPKSLSFLPNYDLDDCRDAPLDPQNFRIADCQGRIGELVKKPQGSRMIQQFIPKATPLDLDIIIEEILPHLRDILLDPYSSSMFQTLLQHSSPEQRMILLRSIAGSIPTISRHKKGTHSLQSIVSILKGDEEEKLFEQSLQDQVLELSQDPYGTHLIQKLINSLSIQRISFVFNVIICNFVEVAQNPHGICVLKAVIGRLEKEVDKKKLIIQLISRNLEELIQNAYGNYAIQHAFEVYKDECKEVWEKIIPRAIQFSTQKFSSNVIEKCIESSPIEIRKKFIETVIRSDRIMELMTNNYGNFVIQKIYSIGDDNEKRSLFYALNKYYEKIYSPKYRTKWATFFEECKKTLKLDSVIPNGTKHYQQQPQSQNSYGQMYSKSPHKQIGHSHNNLDNRKKQQFDNSDSDNDQNDEIYQYNPELQIAKNVTPMKKNNLKKTSKSFNNINSTEEVFSTGQSGQNWQYNQFPVNQSESKQILQSPSTIRSPQIPIQNQSWTRPQQYPMYNGMQPNIQFYPQMPVETTKNVYLNPNVVFQNQGPGFYSYFPKNQ